jgi:NAD(P)-dependent dehydrogenase (short-subunit alcohol dehydrogenase family)
MGRFDGKVAIVTGGASGIGAATARRFATEGAAVVVADLDVPSVDDATTPAGLDIVYQRCDVARLPDWQELVETTLSEHGRIDIVHNNAYTVTIKPTDELEEDDWDRQIDVCLKQVFLSVKTCISHLRASRGSIVNTSSVHAAIGYPNYAAYDAAKGGVCALTRQLAAEFGPDVRVNAVLPGAIMTPAWDHTTDAERQGVCERTPARRMGRADEVAAAVCFLASEDASFITGASLAVDGGWTITKQ